MLEWDEEIEGKEEKHAASEKQSNLRDLMWPFCNLDSLLMHMPSHLQYSVEKFLWCFTTVSTRMSISHFHFSSSFNVPVLHLETQ